MITMTQADIHRAVQKHGSLRAVRVHLGLSQPKFGELLGVTQTAIATWENERQPTQRLATSLAGRGLYEPLEVPLPPPEEDSVDFVEVAANAYAEQEKRMLATLIRRHSRIGEDLRRFILRLLRELASARREFKNAEASAMAKEAAANAPIFTSLHAEIKTLNEQKHKLASIIQRLGLE